MYNRDNRRNWTGYDDKKKEGYLMSDSKDFVIKNGVLTQYVGIEENVVVPEGVTAIGEGAFSRCGTLKRVVLSESVTVIGSKAFEYCEGLQKISFYAGLVSIGKNAFYCCRSLTGIELPEGVTDIGSNAFGWCEALRSITIPDGVSSIGVNAFSGCSRLESISIPESVTTITAGLFAGCEALKSVILPESVTAIGGNAFSRCSSLTSISIPKRVTSIKWDTFSGCSSLTRIVLPDGLTQIGEKAFYDCGSLTEIVIPSGVTAIETAAFKGCKCLADAHGLVIVRDILYDFSDSIKEDIIVPAHVQGIGANAFGGCNSLRSIIIPEGVTQIGTLAFSGCRNLEKVSFPESLVKIGGSLLSGCRSLQFIQCPNRQYDMIRSSLNDMGACPVLLLREDNALHLLVYGKNKKKDILSEYVENGKWNKYDLELINNGPQYKFKPLVRALGALGRLLDPVDLTEENRAAFADMVNINAKKLIPLAEKLQCPALAQAILQTDVLDEKNMKAVMKLLTASSLPELATLANTVVPKKTDKKPEAPPASKDIHELTTDPSQEFSEKLQEMNGEKKLKKWKISGEGFPSVRWKDGSEAPEVMLKYLLVAYGEQMDSVFRFISDADAAASLLSYDSLCNAMEAFRENLNGPEYPAVIPMLCRYGNARQIEMLCSQWKDWGNWDQYHQRGRKAQMILEGALVLNDTREAFLWLEKHGDLARYAEIRGKTVEEAYESFLFDFGFDESGKRALDLGVTTIEITLGRDMTFVLLNTTTGKPVKMIPKKGVDPSVKKKAADELSDMRKSLKKAIKIKNDQLFADFIEGTEVPADHWQRGYLHNPFLRGIASLMVWAQEDATFILTDVGTIDSAGQPYTITDAPIRVSHPMEMKGTDIEAWQQYFTAHGLKQPFYQIWEPVFRQIDIREDRYEQVIIPLDRLRHQEKRGIDLEWWRDQDDYGRQRVIVHVQGFVVNCEEAEYDDNENVTHVAFNSIQPAQWNRRANTVIAYLDRITIHGRIRKDDVSVMDQMSSFTLAQITEFTAIAQEANAVNVLALLLEYKNDHFAGFDPMEEFTLEW